MTFTAVVLAHQGGWDEALMVAAPIVLFVVLLRVANARALAAEDPESPVPSDPDADPEDDRDPEDPR